MSGLIPLDDIRAARNSKIAAESTHQPEADRITSELEGAHQDALHLKAQLREEEGEGAVLPQQAYPHGGVLSTGAMSSDNNSNNNTGTQDNISAGERVAEGIANTDQTMSTAARDAVHRVSEGVAAAGNAAASAAGAVVDKAREMVGAQGSDAGAGREGRTGTSGYEGAVFSSDDPDYKQQQHNGGGVTETRTPAHTLDELQEASKTSPHQNPTIASPKEKSDQQQHHSLVDLLMRPADLLLRTSPSCSSSFVIASPKEPTTTNQGSLGEGSVGVAAGDPAGGANVVAAARTAGKGIVSTVKEAFSGGSAVVAGAPAGPSDPDPRTANIPVGDFKALHEALHLNKADTAGATSKTDTVVSSDSSSRGTTDQDNAANMPSTDDIEQGWEGVKSEAQQGLEVASDKVQQGIEAVSDRVQGAAATTIDAGAAKGTGATGGGGGGGGLLGGLAGVVSSIATKVNLANSSEELLAGGTVPDAAAGPAAADGPTTNTAPEATAAADAAADAAGKACDSVAADSTEGSSSDVVGAAKAAAADTADRVKEGAAELRDSAADKANAAADAVKNAGQSVQAATSDAAQRAADAAQSAKDSAAETAAATADKASGAVEQAKNSAGGGLSSLIQGAKEGFVGAFDAAASVLTGDDKPAATPAAEDSTTTPAAAQLPSSGLQSGAVGSGHAAAPQAGIGAVLKQGWEDLKHGGAKAPHAVSTGGETAASFDVTSNVERSKHLDDEQQAKIYKAETYSVAPGAQASADQAATDSQHRSGAVAGNKRPVTGAVPHDKPDTYKVHADQTNRFSGDKGIASGFGTGSAAPWTGDDSIKRVTALFDGDDNSTSLDMGTLSPEEQQGLVEVATQAAAAGNVSSVERVGSSAEAATSSWVSSMSAVWSHLGVVSAKGPTGKDAKEIGFDNPKQDAMVDPERGVTKVRGEAPGNKIMMRPREQIPSDSDVTDPQFYKDKAERLGKVVTDTLTTSSEEAAADPDNLKGKSSDNRPDGLQYYAKHEVHEAAQAVGRAPEAAVSALGTAGEIVAGVAGHVVDKAKELGHNITTYGDFKSAEERTAQSQAAVERAQKNIDSLGAIATDHRAVQELQEQRMAAIGNPAHKRETLGDKVIGPLVKDASDDTHAKELAASYHEWRDEKEHGASASTSSSGQAPAAAGGGSSSSSGIGGAGAAVADAARDMSREAGDTADATKEVVKMEGRAAGEGVEAAADKAGAEAGGAVDAVKDLAAEAGDTARAAGEVVSMEVASGINAVKGAADKASTRVGDAARNTKHTAQRTTDQARDSAKEAADHTRDAAARTRDAAQDSAGKAGDKAREAVDSVKESASRAGDSAKQSASRAGDSVKESASRAGDSVTEGASQLSDKLQEGVDAVAEGTGRVAGEGAEYLSEAQDAAARAGEKAGTAAGGVLSSVGDAAKALLGNLMGPFEREAAFDESTAAITGPPKDFEVVGAEQLVEGRGASSSPTTTSPPPPPPPAAAAPPRPAEKQVPASATTAAAPAGVDLDELRAKAEDTKQGLTSRLQAGIDDTARAAGLAAGHVESVVEEAKQKLAAVQDKVAEATEDIHVPPAELTTNTEDLLRQRQRQVQQQ